MSLLPIGMDEPGDAQGSAAWLIYKASFFTRPCSGWISGMDELNEHWHVCVTAEQMMTISVWRRSCADEPIRFTSSLTVCADATYFIAANEEGRAETFRRRWKTFRKGEDRAGLRTRRRAAGKA